MLPPLLSTLRTSTRSAHSRTEAAFVLASPGVTRAEYVVALAHLFAFYTAVESAVAPWGPTLAAYGLVLGERRKTPLLARDLLALGAELPTAGAPPLDLPDLAHALGALYVTEGATLGGQLLRRRLGPALGLAPARGLAFFTAYGPQVGVMWKAFGDALARFDAGLPAAERAPAHAAAVGGARRTFAAFERDVVVPSARPALACAALAHPA